MIEKLELVHLRTFDALSRLGNLSVAAEDLGVTQQAISSQLKRIRLILGDQLFVRTGHGVIPTPYAQRILPHVQRVLSGINEIPLPNSITPEQVVRTLTISATDYAQHIIVAPLLRELRVAAPGVRLLVANIEVSSLTKKMHQGQIDLTLTSDGYVPQGLVTEPLLIERYVCTTANQALVPALPLAIESLVQHDFIVTNPALPSIHGSADNWLAMQGLQRKVAVSSPSFHMTKQLLLQSDMVAFLPSRLMPCPGLFEIPLQKYPPGYQMVAAYHASAKDDQFMLWLLERIKRLAALVSDTSRA